MTTQARVRQRGRYDWALLAVVTLMVALGLVMVFSASFPRGLEGYGDPFHFINYQLFSLLVGIVALIVTARIPYTFWDRWSIPLMGLALLSLMAVILFGTERFGATRTFFNGSMQPSEPAKVVIIVYVSAWLTSKGRRIRDAAGLLPFGVLMGIVAVLIVLQPEISTAILIVVTAAVMLFIAGADIKQLFVVGLIAAITFWLVITYSSYAGDRVARFMASVGNPLDSKEWQVAQGVQALMRGGVTGLGIGNGSAQQTGFLPVSWSDNIFGVIGEELGLLGALFVIMLFALLAFRGLRIALRAPDNFGMLLATGITTMLILQALLNMAVIVAAAPPTGVTLPFISYGGSSLVASLASIGMLLSISRYGVEQGGRSSEVGRYAYERLDIGRGTGGHVYPALAVAPQLARAASSRQRPDPVLATGGSGVGSAAVEPDVDPVQTCWVGSAGGMEQALVERAGIRYFGISTGQMRVMNPVKVFASMGKMAAGVRQSLALVDEWRPDVCFVTGGYVCGPVAVACAMRKVPVIIYLPDITPGYAIRWLSKLAQRVAVSLPEVAQRFGGEAPQGKAVVTGYPVRQALIEAAKDRPQARRQLAEALQRRFDEAGQAVLPLLLVWGGSQGARAINRATWAAASELLAHAHVLHVVGARDWPLYEEWRTANPLPPGLAERYHPVAYLHEEMPLALAAADLTVARAGASTLGEFPVARLPAILAPYEGVNQMDNAQALASRGAAIIVRDEELAARLGPTVVELLKDQPRRRAMEAAMAGLARPEAALAIAQAIVALATRKG